MSKGKFKKAVYEIAMQRAIESTFGLSIIYMERKSRNKFLFELENLDEHKFEATIHRDMVKVELLFPATFLGGEVDEILKQS